MYSGLKCGYAILYFSEYLDKSFDNFVSKLVAILLISPAYLTKMTLSIKQINCHTQNRYEKELTTYLTLMNENI